jgi:uncharacterized protein YggE
MEKEMNRKILFSTLALTLLLASCAPIAGGGATRNTLSVTGQSEVALTPDIAYVSIGVRTEASDVGSAVARNADAVESVMALLAESGIAPEDMRTSNFSVYSVDEYDNLGQREGFNYFVDNTVNVTVRDLPSLGDLLDDAVRAGANTIWGVQFDVADRSEATAEARDAAVADAKAQAEALAAATGVSLGEIASVSFSRNGAGVFPAYGVGSGGGGGVAYDTAATSIVPGQITVSAAVYLAYDIR